MTLSPGTRLGSYEVTAQIGEGGMGEVYRATDTRLGRQVAIKVLPASVAQDPDRLARFDREARTLASLNHPNIAAIHGLEHAAGTQALVMELVEGPTLAERIAQGPIPIDDALPMARQIADALAAAHEQGIIHRDLKPANIKVRADGTVKVLDFGLAKALEQGAGIRDQGSGGLGGATMSPTITSPAMTQAGLILGTAAYMSPEQARGKTVDKRADIWAYGCVVYEMLTGTRAFDAEDVSLTLSVVLQKEPDFSALPASVPSHVAQALRLCLRKDPKQRVSDINDVRLALDGAFAPPTAAPAVQATASIARQRLMRATLAAAVLMAVLSTYAWWPSRPIDQPLTHLSVELGPDAVIAPRSSIALSPDGRRIAFVGNAQQGTRQLFTRRLDEPVAKPVEGTAYGTLSSPFFSPDGAWIGFVTGQAVWKVPAEGGAAVPLVKSAGAILGASWGDDDRIVIATTSNGLLRVSSSGGTPETVKSPSVHFNPQVLPGSRAVISTVAKLANFVSLDDSRIEVLDLDTGTAKTVLVAGYSGHYLPTSTRTGHLVFVQQGTLYGVAFDPQRLETLGTPTPLLQGVGSNSVSGGGGQFTFSTTGTFAYLSAGAVVRQYPISSMDASGRMLPLVAQPGTYGAPRLSPDGSKVAYVVTGPKGSDVWVYDVQRKAPAPLTFTGSSAWELAWAPDSKHLIFAAAQSINWIRADGAGEPQKIVETNGPARPFSMTRDGRLAYGIWGPEGTPDLWTVPIDLSDPARPKPGKPEPFLPGPDVVVDAAFSPDGRFLAYVTTEFGPNELFVRPFAGRGRRQIAVGKFPDWSGSDTAGQLFFLGVDDRIMVVDYTTDGEAFLAGNPRPWAPTQVLRDGVRQSFDMSADGTRAIFFPRPTETRTEGPLHATFLLNFFDEVRRRIP